MFRFIITSVFLLSLLTVSAQNDSIMSAYLPYETTKNHTDQMSKFTLDVYLERSDVIYLANVSYFQPRFFYSELSLGRKAAKLSTLFFLFSKKNQTKRIVPVVRNSRLTPNYGRISDTYYRKRYFGIHAGYAFKSFYKQNGFLREDFKAQELALGLGMFSGRYYDLINKKNERGMLKYTWSVYADLLWYNNFKYPVEGIPEIKDRLGFRIESQARWISNFHVGFLIKLGGGYYTRWYPVLGAGFLSFF